MPRKRPKSKKPPIPTPDDIQYWMALYAVSTRMLAEHLNYCCSHMRNLITGRSPITPECGLQIRDYFTQRKQFWHAEAEAIHDLNAA